jgi:hypothetical protein
MRPSSILLTRLVTKQHGFIFWKGSSCRCIKTGSDRLVATDQKEPDDFSSSPSYSLDAWPMDASAGAYPKKKKQY